MFSMHSCNCSLKLFNGRIEMFTYYWTVSVSIIYLGPGRLTKTIQTGNTLKMEHSTGIHWSCCCLRMYGLNLFYNWGYGGKQEDIKIMRLWNYMHTNYYMSNQRWSMSSNIIYFHSVQWWNHLFLFNDKSGIIYILVLNEMKHLEA